MEDHTILLLKECSSGCKMAMESIDQVLEYVTDDNLYQIMEKSRNRHKELETRARQQLQEYGETEEEPGMMASVFAQFSTHMKLMVKGDSHQVAKIMMDGCHMGVESVSKYLNQYTNASPESRKLAEDLVEASENFQQNLKQFL